MLRMRFLRKAIEQFEVWGTIFSCFIPLLFLSDNGHNCEYDYCMKIFDGEGFGICIEKAINDFCLVLAIMWYFVVIGGLLIRDKCKTAVSPYVFICSLIAVSVFAALLDPSKWAFVFASLIPTAFFVACDILDNKRTTECDQ